MDKTGKKVTLPSLEHRVWILLYRGVLRIPSRETINNDFQKASFWPSCWNLNYFSPSKTLKISFLFDLLDRKFIINANKSQSQEKYPNFFHCWLNDKGNKIVALTTEVIHSSQVMKALDAIWPNIQHEADAGGTEDHGDSHTASWENAPATATSLLSRLAHTLTNKKGSLEKHVVMNTVTSTHTSALIHFPSDRKDTFIILAILVIFPCWLR